MSPLGHGKGFYRENRDISTRISPFSTRQQALWCPPRSLLLSAQALLLRARTTWWPPRSLLRHAQGFLLNAQGLLPSARSSWGAPHVMLLAAQSLLLLAQSPLPAAQSHLLPQTLPLLAGAPGSIEPHDARSRAAKEWPKIPSTRRCRAGEGGVDGRRIRGWLRSGRSRSPGRCRSGRRSLP